MFCATPAPTSASTIGPFARTCRWDRREAGSWGGSRGYPGRRTPWSLHGWQTYVGHVNEKRRGLFPLEAPRTWEKPGDDVRQVGDDAQNAFLAQILVGNVRRVVATLRSIKGKGHVAHLRHEATRRVSRVASKLKTVKGKAKRTKPMNVPWRHILDNVLTDKAFQDISEQRTEKKRNFLKGLKFYVGSLLLKNT